MTSATETEQETLEQSKESSERNEPTEAPAKDGESHDPLPNVSAPDGNDQPSEHPHKKRRPKIQLNKDDHPEEECESDDELNDDGEKRSDPFKRASEDVLRERKIVKASKKWGGSAAAGGTGGGTFAGVQLVPSSAPAHDDSKEDTAASSTAPSSIPVFGSDAKVPSFGSAAASGKSTFGSGFGAVSNGFGSIKSTTSSAEEDKSDKDSPPKKAFGQGFGSVSTGFGAVKPSTTGFGSTDADSSTTNADTGSTGAFATSITSSDKFVIQSSGGIANGEEDEDCLCSVRAKLFKLAPVAAEQEAEDEKGESVPSVPSTSGRMELKKEEDEDNDETNDESKGGKEGVKIDWHEVGIGPARVLKRKVDSFVFSPIANGNDEEKDNSKSHARVVQRRETAPGGQGTKLILNVRLVPQVCHVSRKSEKCVQLDAPNSDEDESGRALVSYLFRVKTAAEADLFQTTLEKMLSP